MGGSGGGFRNLNIDRIKDQLKDDLKKSIDATQEANYKAKVEEFLNNQLKDFNDRDARKVEQKLEEIKKNLNKEIDGTIDTRFGGSISKHTYVDGISDIDSLVIVNTCEWANDTPNELKVCFIDQIKGKLSDVEDISQGKLAVTIKYKDGTEVQLLPAIKVSDGLKIPSADGSGWSKINPQGFADKLTQINKKMEGKLVSTIKLVKGINGQFPEKKQLSGYHIESLAIEVFKNYNGEKTPGAMTEHFFEQAKDMVLYPIKDKTGQSLHVDEYLGAKNSELRKAYSYELEIISRKMKLSRNTNKLEVWKEIFGE